MKKKHATTEAKMLPSFKMCLVIVTYWLWFMTATYAETPIPKRAGTTDFAIYLTLLLSGLGQLSKSSEFARGFIFTNGLYGPKGRRTSQLVIVYMVSLLAMYFALR